MTTPRDKIEVPTFAATVTSAAVIAQQVAGKAIRDALYLTSFDVKTLPRVMAVGAILSLFSVFLVSRALLRSSPRRLLPWIFLGSATGLAFGWLLALILPGPAAVVVYLHTAVMSPILISTFWSHINERYDPFTAKRAVARIASGGTLGGVLGGLAAWRASSLLTLTNSILLLAALNVLCLAGVLLSRAKGSAATRSASASILPPDATTQELHAPLALLARTPFLRNLGLLVVAGSAISSLLDYVFTAQATATFGKGEELLAFFSLFGLAVGVLSLAVQVAFGRIATEKLSLAMNIGFLPGVIVLGGALGLAVPGLGSASVLRGGELLYRNSLFRSAYELFYTPVSETTKRATKAIIDVGLDRLGTVIGAALMAVAIITREPQRVSLGVVVILAVATFPLIRKLHQGYVAALEQGLREGGQALDAMARPTTAPPGGAEEEGAREKLQQKVEALTAKATPNGLTRDALAARQMLATAATNLLSRDQAVTRAALASWDASQWPLAGLVIARLSEDALQADARAALKRAAGVVTGQLVDTLTEPRMEPIVRRRVARVLAGCRSQRAADGLLLGLADPRFEVRYACARSLLHVTDENPEVVLSHEKVTETVLREVKQVVEEAQAAEEVSDDDDEDKTDEQAILDWMLRDRVTRSLEHVFTLLGLVLDREPLRMCLRALHHEDVKSRGTALEYLQTVLPSELRTAVWPLVGDAMPLPAPRAASEVLTELANVLAKKAEVTVPEGSTASRS